MNKYKWDFSHLYKNEKDFKKDLSLLDQKYKKLISFKGKVNSKSNFLDFLKESEELSILKEKISLYLIKTNLNSRDLEIKKIIEETQIILLNNSEKLSWVEEEILNIGLENTLNWIKNTNLKHYKFNLESFFESKKHILDSKTQEILTKVAKTRSVAHELYSTLSISDKETPKIEHNKKQILLTQKKFMDIMKVSHPLKDQELRKKSSIAFNKKYFENKFSFAEIYKGIIFGEVEDTKLKKFNSPLEKELFYLNIPKEIFETLITQAQQNSNLVSEHNKLIFNYLKNKYKIKKPLSSDASLELFKYSKKISVDKALEIIENVSKSVSKDYHQAFKIATRPGLIDYYETEFKEKGAFSSGNSFYDPMILMNYDDTIDSVLTLAHEIGHSIHTILSNKNQPYIYQGYSIFLAEIASFTLETLTLDYLLEQKNTLEEKNYLISKKIDLYFSTFFRQSQFAKFEHKLINDVFEDKIIDVETISDFWKQNSKDFGNDEKLFKKITTESKYWWARISHFFHSPYYVYQYATCIVASMKFVQEIKNNNPTNFINLLKSGSHKYPNSILLDNNIDLTKKSTYQPLYLEIKKLLNLLKLK